MALIDKASLLFVPSVVAEGKAFNILPSGNRAPDSTDQNSGYDQTRADFDFDRGTDHAATRVNADGLIEKYRENKLLRSNQFDTTWTNTSSTETGGQEGYDGTTNAWKIDITATYGQIIQSVSLSGVNCTSLYVKAGSLGFVRLRLDASPNAIVDFDLSDGSTAYTSGIIDASSESIGNGWYRISMVSNVSSSTFRIYPLIAANDLTGSSGNIYIQSAQIESGLVATDVLTSGATTAKAGVLVDMPRINFDANGENGSLLLEPSRQQLFQYSEYFGASYWTKSGASVVSGFTSPEGLSNAYKLVEDTSSGTHSFVFPAINTSSNNTYSIYIKANGRTKIGFREVQETGYYAAFNLSSNVVIEKSSQVTASIVPLNNGWKRCEINFPVTTSTVMGFYMLSDSYTTGDPLTTTYTGDGSSGVYIFGAQLEANATYASSYIPNHGESGGVTRAADSCSVTGVSDVIGQSEGTIFVDVPSLGGTTNGYILECSDGSNTNRIIIQRDSASDYKIFVQSSAGEQLNNAFGGTFSSRTKIAFAYANNDYNVYVNGISYLSGTSFDVPNCTQLNIGERYNNTTQLGGNVQQVTLFKTRLTNAELATLTTL